MLAQIAPIMTVTKNIFNNEANPNFVQQKHQIQFAKYLYRLNYTANSFLNLTKPDIISLLKKCFGYNPNSNWFAFYSNNIPEMYERVPDSTVNKLAITN